jgi:hypothetical protein
MEALKPNRRPRRIGWQLLFVLLPVALLSACSLPRISIELQPDANAARTALPEGSEEPIPEVAVPLRPPERFRGSQATATITAQIQQRPGEYQGPLRVANLSEHPVRLVLLNRRQATAKPTHWDFDPGEMGQQGLILSLPKGDVRLQPDDILTAFSLDGSRAYWGPYVVGRSAQPQWHPRHREWQLTLTARS